MKTIKLYMVDDEPEKIVGFKSVLKILKESKKYKFVNGFGKNIAYAAKDAHILIEALENANEEDSLWILDIKFENEDNLTTAKTLERHYEINYSFLNSMVKEDRYYREKILEDDSLYLFRVLLEVLLDKKIPFVLNSKAGGGIPKALENEIENTIALTLVTYSTSERVIKITANEIENFVSDSISDNALIDRFLKTTINNPNNHVKAKESNTYHYQYLAPLSKLLDYPDPISLLQDLNLYAEDQEPPYRHPNLIEECYKSLTNRGLSLGGAYCVCWAAYTHKMEQFNLVADPNLFIEPLRNFQENWLKADRTDHPSAATETGSYKNFARSKILNNDKQTKIAFAEMMRRLYDMMMHLYQNDRTGKSTLSRVVIYPEKLFFELYLNLGFDLIAAVNHRIYHIDQALVEGGAITTENKTSAAIIRFINSLDYSDKSLDSGRFPNGGVKSFGGRGKLLITHNPYDTKQIILKFIAS